ncbi:MAG TPA: 50S ribosomal protein L9 [Candidatus Nitrosotalea sp.]|nr:50S ribosomal protein L9 [Candidatus Nitrosotalea sp.]
MLTENVDNVGLAGDIKEVTGGFGRNYLIPRGLARIAGRGAEDEARRLKEAAAKKENRAREEAREQAEEIGNKTVVVRLRMGADGKAFGAVTSEDIAVALKAQHQVEIDRRRIDLADPIKQLGEHQVALRLHRDVVAQINLIVTQDR